MSQPAHTELRAFRDAVYHRHKVDPTQQLPPAALVEARALRYADFRAADPAGSQDSELVRHWAVADLIAARDTTAASEHERIKRTVLVNAINYPHYAATVAEHSPELLRSETHALPSLLAVDAAPTAIDRRLAALGYRMEASLSSLDSEDDGHALVDLVTQDLVDPPNDEVRSLMEAWTAEQDAASAPRRAMQTISDNHARLLRSIEAGVVPKEEIHALAAEDVAALSALSPKEQRAAAAMSMAQSAAAHPAYAQSLVEIDELIAREVAAADAARRQTEAEFLLVQVERRRELFDGADAAGLTAAAHADAEAFARISSDEERLLALIVIGNRAQKLPGYAAALPDVNQQLAEEAAAASAKVQAAFHDGAAHKADSPSEAPAAIASDTEAPSDPQAGPGFGDLHPLLREVQQRARQIQSGELSDSDLVEAARADVAAVMAMPTDEASARALESLRWTTAFNSRYKEALQEHAPQVARLAEELQEIVLDSAYGDSRSADSSEERASVMRELRAMRAAAAASEAPQPAPAEASSDEPDGTPEAETAAIEAIRARHASRREVGAPIDALNSTEIARLAVADAADIAAVTSAEGLRTVAADMADCLTNADYAAALESADLRSAATLHHLHYQLMMLKAQREQEAEAARKRGMFGVLAEEGEAPYPYDDAERVTYFVRYVEDSGRVGTMWGRHLPAALRQAGAAVGDRLQLARGPIDPSAAAEGDLGCDKTRFTVHVLERAQLVDSDADEAASPADEALPTTPAPATPASAPAPTDMSTADPAAMPPDHAQGQVPTPASAAAHVQAAIDARIREQVAARRARDSASAREAAGLASDDSGVPPRAPDASRPTEAPSPSQAGARATAPTAKSSAATPERKTRPADPTANGVTGEPADGRPVPSEAIAKLLESVTYEVKGNGSVLYLVRGKAAFVDHSQQILMHDAGNEEDDAILAAILLAKEKWGKVELTGTQAFKQRALELLVKHGIDVPLKNAEQDAMRRQLTAAAAPTAAPVDVQEPRIGKARQPAASATSTAAPSASAARAPAAVPTQTPTSPAGATAVAGAPAAPTAESATATVLAKDLLPIRARDWWSTQRAAIEYWSKGRSLADLQADLAKLGPEPHPEHVFWFEPGGRRCDPPADAKAFAESLAATDANLKEIDMANPKGKSEDAPVLLRGVVKDGDDFKTTALLFKGKGDYLQGFIEANGERHQVIVHINERKPDGDGVLRPNFLKVSERIGTGDNAQWKEIGFGNAVNHRSDGKVVHFDEVLFNIGQEVVKARVTAKVDADMHRHLGFIEPRKSRDAAAAVAPQEAARPKGASAAHVQEDVAAEAADRYAFAA